MNTLFIVGLGMIGGSVARGAREQGLYQRIVGFDADVATANEAQSVGVVDALAATVAEGARDADVTLLATPVGALPSLLAQLQPVSCSFALESRWVTDVGSVKGAVINAATALYGELPEWFVPGHPLAGSERSGLRAASSDLFRGRKVLLCPTAATCPAAIAAIERLWHGVGATTEHVGAIEHDRLLAMTSHLPHVLAFGILDALLAVESAAVLFRYSGGGFRDFTRLASSDPVMWRDIALNNSPPLLAAMDIALAHLTQLRDVIAGGDATALEAAFLRAKRARDAEL